MAHDYGLGVCYIKEYTTAGENPTWVKKPYKRVLLVNVNECKNRITVSHVLKRLDGMGYKEWEELLTRWLVEAVVEAIHDGKEEADISKMFSCDLHGHDHWGTFCKEQNRVIDFLMGRLFECITEDDEVMRVRIIEKSICEAQT